MDGRWALQAMIRYLGWAVVIGGLLVPARATPTMAEDVCVQTLPLEVTAVTGWAWIGIVRSVEHRHVRGGVRTVVTFDAESALATRDGDATVRPGSDLVLASGPCERLTGFTIGQEYLVSTRDIHRPGSDDTAAWLLHGSQAVFLVMHPDQRYDPTLAVATTRRLAADLVAPGSELLPTSTASEVGRAGGPTDLPVALLMGVMAMTSCAALLAVHRRLE